MAFFEKFSGVFKGKKVKLPEEKNPDEGKVDEGKSSEQERPFKIEEAESRKFGGGEEEGLIEIGRIQKQAEARTAEVIATIEKGESGFTAPDAVREELRELKDLARAAKEGILKKISEQLGSNEGGWYEDRETKKRYYVKFYKNPDQARVEFITNAIYEKLGLNAVKSQLVEMGGKLAIASEAVEGAKDANPEEQAASPDVHNGFIADAYLANWDVVGLVFDNIVKDGQGRMHRIDNGGSIIFRAQGGAKDFPPDRIQELESMLRPEFPAGQVFSGMTEKEMKNQAQTLVDKLKDKDIDAILGESGVTGKTLEKIRAGLKGRREFLIKNFGLEEKSTTERKGKRLERIPKALAELKKEGERLRDVNLQPRVGILADRDKIENQQVDIIDASSEGYFRINFKLTAEHLATIKAKMEKLFSEGRAKEGIISYGPQRLEYQLAKAWKIERDGIIIKISQDIGIDDKEVRSSIGLVDIQIPGGESIDEGEMEKKINQILVDLLEIPEGLAIPDAEAEKQYKLARYAWQHKLDVGDPFIDWDSIEKRLVREEVAPDYSGVVDKDRHKEYERRFSPYASFHTVSYLEAVAKILKSGGVFSSHERYRRGLLADGTSSAEDLRTGGGDSVFTRTITEAGAKIPGCDSKLNEIPGACHFVFNPRIFDRTDWYAYDNDAYGSTEREMFANRQTPEELFESQKKWKRNDFGSLTNEQMFRLGISVEDVEAIACFYDAEFGWQGTAKKELERDGIREIGGIPLDDILIQGAEVTRKTLMDAGITSIGGESLDLIIGIGDERDQTLALLRSSGIEEINGKPIEDFVVYAKKVSDFVDIARGKKARSMRKSEMREDLSFTIEAA